jgi:hypothetical protein
MKASEITANELRIGNYLYEKYWNETTKDFQYSLIIVNATYKTHIVCQDNCAYNFEDLQPIELTEEILLKCGFELCYNQNNYKRYEIILKSTIIYLRPSLDSWYWGFMNDDFECEINECYELEFLHTLQNLIHSLTNNELTINL